jgi:hypothetical protein
MNVWEPVGYSVRYNIQTGFRTIEFINQWTPVMKRSEFEAEYTISN